MAIDRIKCGARTRSDAMLRKARAWLATFVVVPTSHGSHGCEQHLPNSPSFICAALLRCCGTDEISSVCDFLHLTAKPASPSLDYAESKERHFLLVC